MGHKNDVIQDGGYGHVVSAAPLEKFEPEISCMDDQSCLGNGAPVNTLDTEPGQPLVLPVGGRGRGREPREGPMGEAPYILRLVPGAASPGGQEVTAEQGEHPRDPRAHMRGCTHTHTHTHTHR